MCTIWLRVTSLDEKVFIIFTHKYLTLTLSLTIILTRNYPIFIFVHYEPIILLHICSATIISYKWKLLIKWINSRFKFSTFLEMYSRGWKAYSMCLVNCYKIPKLALEETLFACGLEIFLLSPRLFANFYFQWSTQRHFSTTFHRTVTDPYQLPFMTPSDER